MGEMPIAGHTCTHRKTFVYATTHQQNGCYHVHLLRLRRREGPGPRRRQVPARADRHHGQRLRPQAREYYSQQTHIPRRFFALGGRAIRAAMDASRASDPRGEALIISLGWCSFRLDRVSVAPSAARALASRFPRLRGFPYLVVGSSTLGHDADHGTPPLFDSAGYQGPGWPGWRWLQGLHRGWLRPQDVSVQSRILAYPASDGPKSKSRVFPRRDLASDSPGRIDRSTRVVLTLTYAPPLSPRRPQPLRQGWLRLQARPPQRQG